MKPSEFSAKLAALPAEEPDALDLAMLADAEQGNDGSAVAFEEFKQNLADCSGKLNIRIPRSLHYRLREEARQDGVSLNQYILYKLAQ